MKYSKIVAKRNSDREKLDAFVKNGKEEHYLFTYKFKTSIFNRFKDVVAVNDLFVRKAANGNYAVAKFIQRVLPLLRYFEKECDAELFRDRKAYAERNRKRIRFVERELVEEYTNQICVNF